MTRRLALDTVAGHFRRYDFCTFFLRHGPTEFCQYLAVTFQGPVLFVILINIRS